MTFGAPIWLAAAGVAAAVAVGLHLLARRPPRSYALPTARFVPDRPARTTAPTTRPTDLLLLLVRVTALLLLGAALARPQTAPPRRVHTIVALDRSRSATTELDSVAAAVVRNADLVITFDSTATMMPVGGAPRPAGGGRGSLSTALVAAMRAAPGLARSADSIELAIVSPFMAEEWDEATLDIRESWSGRIRLVPIAKALPAGIEGGGLRASAGDPITATVALGNGLPAGTRLVRTVLTAEDSAWAERGGTLVFWPVEEAGWPSLPGLAAGVVAGPHAAVAPFGPRVALPSGRVVARWADGTPAATERALGAGCERDVGISIPDEGDIPLRPGIIRLVRQLSEPCGGPRGSEVVPQAQLDSLRGSGGLLAPSSIPVREEGRVPANLGLLIAAGVLVLLEPLLRRDRAAA
ncbi:MAG: BatA domain-containing protein [Gemmatimonadales bacterium]